MTANSKDVGLAVLNMALSGCIIHAGGTGYNGIADGACGVEGEKDSSDMRHPRNDSSETVLIFADVFVPDGGIFLDVVGEESDAFLGIETDDFNARGAEPFDTALEGAALADDDPSKIKLPD